MKSGEMFVSIRNIIAGGALILVLASASSAQEAVLDVYDGDTPVITFDGGAITVRDLVAERRAVDSQINPQMSDQTIYEALVDRLERRVLLSAMAEQQNIAANPDIARRLVAARQEILAQAYLEQQINLEPSDDELRAFYDEHVAQLPSMTETRSRHILVPTEEEAKAIRAALDGGADFAQIAKEKSTGPSGPSGGDLGFHGPGALVAPYEDAANDLEIGEISDPVQTQFGWHVIKVEERREVSQVPPFAQIRETVTEMLIQQRSAAFLEEIRPMMQAQRAERRPPYDVIRRDDLLPQ